MFTEKEKNILQALVEEEITYAIGNSSSGDNSMATLLKDYRLTLTRIHLKLDMEECSILNGDYSDILSNNLLSRQSL